MTTSPDDQQELEKEIERTREQLGETVEALAAKADVKARAQEKGPIPAAATACVVGVLVLFALIRRWMRRDK